MPTAAPAKLTVEELLADQELRDVALLFFGQGGQLKTLNNVTDQQLEGVYDLGVQFYRADKYDKAEPLLQLCCLLDTSQPRFWRTLAATRQMRGNLTGAMEGYAMGLILEPTNPANLLEIATCLMAQGELERAKDALRGVADIGAGDPRHQAVRDKAAKLLAVLEHSRATPAGR